MTTGRPAFYALAPGGWRDYVTLLHPPYTLWHLSYVAIGAALAPALEVGRLLAALAAFFLAVGIGAHALDELHGHPLRTRIFGPGISGARAASIGGAVGIGVSPRSRTRGGSRRSSSRAASSSARTTSSSSAAHSTPMLWFALSWGAFPLLAAYFAVAERLTVEALVAAGFAAFLSLAQRQLSTQVRTVRRRVAAVSGTLELPTGRASRCPRDPHRAPEAALRA